MQILYRDIVHCISSRICWGNFLQGVCLSGEKKNRHELKDTKFVWNAVKKDTMNTQKTAITTLYCLTSTTIYNVALSWHHQTYIMNAHSFIGISGIGLASAPDGLLYLLGGVICFRDYVWHVRSFEEKHEFCPLTYFLRVHTPSIKKKHTPK